MSIYYLDTSALIKRYVQEIGTAWILGLVALRPRSVLLTARVTMVEVYSALARRRREASVSLVDCDLAVQEFTSDSAREYEFIELDLSVITLARDLLDRHPLRAYDAVQLASALTSHRALRVAHQQGLTFVSADARLIGVAVDEGLPVDNPNNHA